MSTGRTPSELGGAPPAPSRSARSGVGRGVARTVTWPLRLSPGNASGGLAPATPFRKLVEVHLLSTGGDAMVAIALAGSVFFNVSLTAARGRTALGLVCTLLPFLVVGPFLGRVIDAAPAGRRAMLSLAAVGRSFGCVLMAEWVHGLAFFPAAFVTLVCSKAYLITRAALLPGMVDSPDQLVPANSKLAVSSAVSTLVAGGIGAFVLRQYGTPAVLYLDATLLAVCAVMAARLRPARPDAVLAPGSSAAPLGGCGAGSAGGPWSRTVGGAPGAGCAGGPWSRTVGGAPGAGCAGGSWSGKVGGAPGAGGWGVGPSGPSGGPPRDAVLIRWRRKLMAAFSGPPAPAAHLPSGGVEVVALTMASMRACAGLMTSLVVFGFRREGAPLYWYGLVGVASVLGNFGGAVLAPIVRAHAREERIVPACALVIGVVGLAVLELHEMHHRPAALILAVTVTLLAAVAKLAFDALVQRDAVPGHRGRSFARLETLFQFVWVAAALVPVGLATPLPAGFAIVAGLALGGVALCWRGLHLVHGRRLPAWWPSGRPAGVPEGVRPAGARPAEDDPPPIRSLSG